MNATLEMPLKPNIGIGPELLELSVLLPTWQVHALADAAEAQGVSIGQMLRSVISQITRAQQSAN
jgi:hypothetical protein